jgi:WD40-like Beta Propeller Repeat
LPAFTAHEEASDLYLNPQPVTIEGYTSDAMEPFIAPDGQWLFFNNSNDRTIDTNLHLARRTGPRAFRYVGELTGANSRMLDAAPSMDTDGRVYFTSMRQYSRDLRSIFVGTFDGAHGLRDVHVIPGTLTPVLPGAINMDVSISPDGQTMYMSRARFVEGIAVPVKSDIIMARRQGDEFAIEPRSGELFARINTPALEYAPAISANGLELYFTRASKNPSEATEPTLRIMVSTRPTPDAPFEEPRVLSALAGYVEAPTLSLDTRELFFHKKVDGRFVIYRAERNPHK